MDTKINSQVDEIVHILNSKLSLAVLHAVSIKPMSCITISELYGKNRTTIHRIMRRLEKASLVTKIGNERRKGNKLAVTYSSKNVQIDIHINPKEGIILINNTIPYKQNQLVSRIDLLNEVVKVENERQTLLTRFMDTR